MYRQVFVRTGLRAPNCFTETVGYQSRTSCGRTPRTVLGSVHWNRWFEFCRSRKIPVERYASWIGAEERQADSALAFYSNIRVCYGYLTFCRICSATLETFEVYFLKNQRDAALSSRIYYSLRDYSTCFRCFLHPSSGVH